MIKGVHAMLLTPDAEATRAFFRDVLGLEGVEVGDGYLICTPSEAELSFHPAAQAGYHVSLYCDDIEATVGDLKAKGVEFLQPIADKGFGAATVLLAPGDLKIELFQPSYSTRPGAATSR